MFLLLIKDSFGLETLLKLINLYCHILRLGIREPPKNDQTLTFTLLKTA